MSNDDIFFDFGFTAATEEELAAPVIEKAELESASVAEQLEKALDQKDDLQARLSKLYDAVQPLLTNLKANPEKPYIHWPDRVTKVDSFWALLTDIYNGKIK